MRRGRKGRKTKNYGFKTKLQQELGFPSLTSTYTIEENCIPKDNVAMVYLLFIMLFLLVLFVQEVLPIFILRLYFTRLLGLTVQFFYNKQAS